MLIKSSPFRNRTKFLSVPKVKNAAYNELLKEQEKQNKSLSAVNETAGGALVGSPEKKWKNSLPVRKKRSPFIFTKLASEPCKRGQNPGRDKCTPADNQVTPEKDSLEKEQSSEEVQRNIVADLLKTAKRVPENARRIWRKVKVGALRDASPKTRRRVKAMAKLAAAIEHKLNSFKSNTQDMVEKVVQERGYSPETTARTKKVVKLIDGILSWTLNVPVAHLALHSIHVTGPGGLIASKMAYHLPVGSLSYLAWSTGRNPLATIRAAKGKIRDWREGKTDHKSIGGFHTKKEELNSDADLSFDFGFNKGNNRRWRKVLAVPRIKSLPRKRGIDEDDRKSDQPNR